MHSQDNSLDRARQIAQQLLEKDVFTTASRDLMLERINNGSLSTNRKVQQADGSYKVEQGDISHSKLLQFVAAVFQSEMSYRAGIFEYGRIINQLEQEGMTAPKTDDQEQLKAYFEQLNKEAEKRLESFEGQFIEERIPSEDSVPPQNRTFYAGGLGLGQRGMDTGGLIAPHRSVYGRTITRNLNDMAVAGLLDSTLLQDCFAQVKAQVHLMEVDVLTYASKALLTQEEFPRKLQAQQQLIQRLVDAEMMVSSTGKRLIEQCKQGQLKSKFELLSYCRYTRLFDLSHSRENLLDGYRRIFKDLNEILPDITVKDVQINLRAEEIDWRDGEFFIRGDLKLTAQDRDYYDFVTHDVMAAKDTITDPERLPIKSVRGINSIVNKILRDQQSDQRLYIAQDEDAEKNNDGFSQKFGLLLLTQEQYKAWQLRPYNDFMPQVSHDNAFHSDAVQSIFAQYQELGLMNHLTEEERTNAWRDIQRKTIDSYQSIIGSIPKSVVFFDWETGNLENPYEDLTKQFAEASRDAFQPSNITDDFKDNWNNEHCNFGFDFMGKRYETKIPMTGDWLNYDFMQLIEKALEENQVDLKIYNCEDGGQAAGYILLSKAQHKFLEENQEGFFPKFE